MTDQAQDMRKPKYPALAITTKAGITFYLSVAPLDGFIAAKSSGGYTGELLDQDCRPTEQKASLAFEEGDVTAILISGRRHETRSTMLLFGPTPATEGKKS